MLMTCRVAIGLSTLAIFSAAEHGRGAERNWFAGRVAAVQRSPTRRRGLRHGCQRAPREGYHQRPVTDRVDGHASRRNMDADQFRCQEDRAPGFVGERPRVRNYDGSSFVLWHVPRDRSP